MSKIKKMPVFSLNRGQMEALQMPVRQYAVLRAACENTFSHHDLIKSLRSIRNFHDFDTQRMAKLEGLPSLALSAHDRNKLGGLRKKSVLVKRVIAGLEDRLRAASIETQAAMKEFGLSQKAHRAN